MTQPRPVLDPSPVLPLCKVLAEEYISILAPPQEGQDDPLESFRDQLKKLEKAGAHGPKHAACLPSVYEKIHAIPQRLKPVALCLSGGGIRSASIGLGVLQGLAKANRLKQLDYLSTVSGGGYIGSWFMAWIHRHPEGAPGVFRELAQRNASADRAVGEEPSAIHHLREYSNYLTPRLGSLSADTWTTIAIYLRNLFLNWLVMGPFLLAILFVPFLCEIAMTAMNGAPPKVGEWLVRAAAGLLAVGIAFVGLHLPTAIGSRAHWDQRKRARWAFYLILFPLIAGHTLLAMYWAPHRAPPRPPLLGWSSMSEVTWMIDGAAPGALELLPAFIVFGAKTYGLGWLLYAIIALAVLTWKALIRRTSTIRASRILALIARIWGASWKHAGVRAGRVALEPLIFVLTGILMGFVTWLAAYQVYPQLYYLFRTYEIELYVAIATPLLLLLSTVTATVPAGLLSKLLTDDDQEWLARVGAWVLLYCVCWFVFSSLILIAGPEIAQALSSGRLLGIVLAATGGVAGLVTTIMGFRGKSTTGTDQRAPKAGIGGKVLAIAMPLFAVFLIVVLSQGGQWLYGQFGSVVTMSSDTWWTEVLRSIVFGIVLLLVGVVAAAFININTFSLHGMYRNRLIRAYLGASNPDRMPSPFTGFDPADNVELYRLQRNRLQIEDLSMEPDSTTEENEKKSAERAMTKLIRVFLSSEDALPEYMRQHASPRSLDQLRRYSDSVENHHKAALALLDEFNAALDDPGLLEVAMGDARFEELHTAYLMQYPNRSEELESMLASQAPRERNELTLVGDNRLILEIFYGFKSREPYKPIHVVNISVNTVGGRDLAWQQRKATLLTATPYHVGVHDSRLGYRRSRDYGKVKGLGNRKRAITLGTAVTISGAAASPNMGYYSSPVLGFLMTLFNARLGTWKGNPGPRGDTTYDKAHPGFAVRPLFSELFGRTDAHNPWVYLSDGGHFDNLGLFSMVLRRCHTIIVVDASADPSREFENLANAIHKIRVDLGVPITFKEKDMFVEKSGKKIAYWAEGRIGYSAVDKKGTDGTITYIKPAVRGGDEPVDVLGYHRKNPKFPHESTMDQWFSESQLESYRMLGEHLIASLNERRRPRKRRKPRKKRKNPARPRASGG